MKDFKKYQPKETKDTYGNKAIIVPDFPLMIVMGASGTLEDFDL